MGQYWHPVNLDKKEFINPHKLGSGLKLWEQLAAHGVGQALVVLTAAMPDARGGGDFDDDQPGKDVIGRWAGDRIAIIGDYAEDGDLDPEHKASTIYARCYDPRFDGGEGPPEGYFTDITDLVVQVIEHEMDGKFVGDGWKEWKANE